MVAGMGMAELLSTKYFIVSHLVLNLGLSIASAAMLAAGMHARSEKSKIAAMSRSFHHGLKTKLIDICAAISCAGNSELSEAYDNLKTEVLRYSNPESDHRVSGIEKQMTGLVYQIKKAASAVADVDTTSFQSSLDELINLKKQSNDQLKITWP